MLKKKIIEKDDWMKRRRRHAKDGEPKISVRRPQLARDDVPKISVRRPRPARDDVPKISVRRPRPKYLGSLLSFFLPKLLNGKSATLESRFLTRAKYSPVRTFDSE